MAELPEDVRRVRQNLLSDPSDKRNAIATKLIDDTPELVKMWQTLEQKKIGNDDLWVWAFLQLATDAATLPPYHYKSKSDRSEILERITNLATELVRALTTNDLDAHLFLNDGKIFGGFRFYEDFGETNRARIDAAGIEKLKVSAAIKGIVERAQQKITEEPLPGKGGANDNVIRFIRIVAKRNQLLHGESMNTIIATAANTIFQTSYTSGDISNLLSR